MSDLPPLPGKPKVLDVSMAEAQFRAARAAYFSQMIEHILVQPVRRFHRKPPPVIAPELDDAFAGDEEEDA